MLTRWNAWFSEENLAKDQNILDAPPSICADVAANEFLSRDKRRILEIASGIGRDTFLLESYGLSVTCTDASLNGLRAAQQRGSAQGTAVGFVNVDARQLPFQNNTFEGIYCFGLLHEFTFEAWKADIDNVMREAKRVLCDRGILAITVLAGNPEKTMPKVRFFTQSMFEHAIRDFRPIEIKEYDDVGCTGRTDYRVWYGLLENCSK